MLLWRDGFFQETTGAFVYIKPSSLISCAAWFAFVYDLVTTLDDEVEFVWKKKIGVGSILYLLTRYLTAVSVCYDIIWSSRPESIDFWLDTVPPSGSYYTGYIVMFLSMLLLQLGTGALYGNSKAVLIWFGIYDTVALGFSIRALYVQSEDYELVFTWVFFLALESSTFVLGLRKSTVMLREQRQHQVQYSPLVKVFFRDNMLYFVIILLLYAFGVILNLNGIVEFRNAHFVCSVAASGTLVPKIFINVRKFSIVQTSEEESLPTIRYESAPQNQSIAFDSTATSTSL